MISKYPTHQACRRLEVVVDVSEWYVTRVTTVTDLFPFPSLSLSLGPFPAPSPVVPSRRMKALDSGRRVSKYNTSWAGPYSTGLPCTSTANRNYSSYCSYLPKKGSYWSMIMTSLNADEQNDLYRAKPTRYL